MKGHWSLVNLVNREANYRELSLIQLILKWIRELYTGGGGGGGGGNFHYKGIYRCAAGMGYTFQASQYMNGYHFHLKSIWMGYLFRSKVYE